MKLRVAIVWIALATAPVTALGATSMQYWMGNQRLAKGDNQGAVESLTTALEKDASNFGALLNRGVAYERLEQLDQALADYTRAIEIVPGFGRAYHNRGLVYSKKGEYDRAIADYDEAIKNVDQLVIEAHGQAVKVDKAALYYDRANTLYQLKRPEEAVESFGSAIALDRLFAAAYNNRGVVRSEMGDKAAACADRSKACELDFGAACTWTHDNCQPAR